MYKIVVGSKVIELCDIPRYVKKKSESGAYIQCSKEDAEAIAVRGTLYNLKDKNYIKDAPEADIMEADGWKVLHDTNTNYLVIFNETIPDVEDAVIELGSYVDESTTDNSDAVIDLADYVAQLEERIATLEGGKE